MEEGPSGIAALSAARNGAKVFLIERYGFLGGNATMYLPLLGFLDWEGKQIIKGTAQEMIDRLRKIEGSDIHRKCPFHVSYTIVDPEKPKSIALEMLCQAGVDILLHTMCVGTLTNGGHINFLIVENKTERQTIVTLQLLPEYLLKWAHQREKCNL